jgi:hypothetical protein
VEIVLQEDVVFRHCRLMKISLAGRLGALLPHGALFSDPADPC